MRLLGLVLFITYTAFAGEYVVLSSGARMHIDRHEAEGAKVRLFHGTGFVELDAANVSGYEIDEAPAPVVSPSVEVVPSPAPATTAMSPRELADAAADRYGLPRELVRSVMAAESGFQMEALSPKGAIGLMQLMPSTAQTLGIDPHDPAQNVDAGTRYLRDLLEKYQGGLRHALAAYNAGSAAVDKYNGVPPYRETIEYIIRIEKLLKASGFIK